MQTIIAACLIEYLYTGAQSLDLHPYSYLAGNDVYDACESWCADKSEGFQVLSKPLVAFTSLLNLQPLKK